MFSRLDRLSRFFNGLLCVAAMFWATSAKAELITFNFNTLSDGASNTSVKTYMQGVLNASTYGGTINVIGSLAEKNYTGDNHVVGPVSGTSVTAYTLGNTDGGVFHPNPLDAFIVNNNNNQITMEFSKKIYSIAFDFEIFPNGNVPNGNTVPTTSYPDFKLEADDVVYYHKYSVMPGTSGTYLHSPASGAVNNEKAPQWLGQAGPFYFPNGVTKFDFIDWPEMIGIDNLVIGTGPENSVPEPSTWLLAGAGLAGLAWFRRGRKLATSK